VSEMACSDWFATSILNCNAARRPEGACRVCRAFAVTGGAVIRRQPQRSKFNGIETLLTCHQRVFPSRIIPPHHQQAFPCLMASHPVH
jgi:hypothetical protein